MILKQARLRGALNPKLNLSFAGLVPRYNSIRHPWVYPKGPGLRAPQCAMVSSLLPEHLRFLTLGTRTKSEYDGMCFYVSSK